MYLIVTLINFTTTTRALSDNSIKRWTRETKSEEAMSALRKHQTLMQKQFTKWSRARFWLPYFSPRQAVRKPIIQGVNKNK